MKKVILTILALVIFVSPSLILADNSNTIAYLQSQTQNNWISQALAAAQVDNLDISYIDYQTNDLMAAAKDILTLAATNSQDGENISQLLAVIESSRNNGQFGSSDLLNDDFWAVLALASVGNLDSTDSVKNFILDNQNEDGGWSWSASGTSDSNDTAAAIMALLDLSDNSSSPEIIDALSYLQTTQNEDGGFAYDSDSQSDGASTAWIIAALNKADIEADSWVKNEHNPISFLESLRQDNGSFLWMASDEQGSAMVTAYALLALSGASYPVNYIDIATDDNIAAGYSLRIEGPDRTVCLANHLEATTVLELLEAGSGVCGFEYTTEDSAYGVYVSSIDGIVAEGMEGWQYFVDSQSGMMSVTDYHLSDENEVLWAYGGFPFYPVSLELNDTHFDVGQSVVASFKYYDGDSWLPLPEADIVLGQDVYQADASGQFSMTMEADGAYPIFSQQTANYIRSNKEYIIVGSGVSQTVDLSVNIEGDDNGGSNGDGSIAFSVDRSSIDFGTLNPGQSSDTIISITNTGDVDVYIEASVLGDAVFTDFTSLDQNIWQDYNLNLSKDSLQSVNIGLDIPSNFDSFGQKEGQLIFWGVSQ